MKKVLSVLIVLVCACQAPLAQSAVEPAPGGPAVADENDQPAPPLHLGIVLLASKRKFKEQQAAATELLQRVFRPEIDQAFVIAAAGKKTWQGERLEWQGSREALIEAIRKMDRNAGIPDAFNFDISQVRAGTSRMALQEIATIGPSPHIFDLIFAMVQSDFRPARRLVVIFRDPWAHSPGFWQQGQEYVAAAHERIIAAARQLNVSFQVIAVEETTIASIHTVGDTYTPTFTGEGSAARAYDEEFRKWMQFAEGGGRSNITRLAEQTGGKIWWPKKKNYADSVEGIAAALRE